jgi:biotin carboxylase
MPVTARDEIPPLLDLLMVGVGRMGRPYVAAARRLGAAVRGVEFGSRAEAVAELVNEVHRARGGFDEPLAEAAYAAATASAPDAVVAFSEEHVMGAALLQDALGLPGPSLHASVLSRNKSLQRARFAASGIAQPDFVVTQALPDAEAWAAGRFPVVVKPLSSSGSAGELVRDLGGFRAAADRRARDGRLLVETAVQGPEYSWEGLVREGEVWFGNITAKETTGPPHFVEVAHRTAAELDDDVATEVHRLARDVIAALRFRTGLMHLELRIAETGPTVIEVAVRTPGDFIMDLLGLTYGIDWFEMTLRLAFGLPLPSPPTGPVKYAASYLLVARPGRVTAVEGLSEVRAHASVVQADVKVGEGDVIPATTSSLDRVGSAIVAADTRAELEDALAFVRRTLCVRTETPCS